MLTLPELYRPAQVPVSQWGADERDRPVNFPVLEQREHMLCTVRGFDVGGFEMTVRAVDLQALIDSKMRAPGRRKPIGERDERDVVRSVNRAKRNVRHAVKQIGCDHLLTLTTREDANTPESLQRMWQAWVRRYRFFAREPFPYVAIAERHPSNLKHWHLHVAVRGRLKLSIARHMWWHVCGGRGMGNVDIQYIKVPAHRFSGDVPGPLVRSAKIARYLSKYMTKDLMFTHRPDKKRYWRSEFPLPGARHYWLKTSPDAPVGDLFGELLARFGGFDLGRCGVFMFPSAKGFWLEYNPDAGGGDGVIPF